MEIQPAPSTALTPSHPRASTSVRVLVPHRNRVRQYNKSFGRTALTIVSFLRRTAAAQLHVMFHQRSRKATTPIGVVLLVASLNVFADDVPPNAHPNIFGNGWECDRGYSRSGNVCVKVVLPNNASLNVFGNGWECNRGYKRAADRCTKVNVPDNASINVFGNDWACNRGYARSGSGCVKIIIPDNASINVYGNGWSCNRGFKKAGGRCEPMSAEELTAQAEHERQILKMREERKLRGVSGDDCENEYKTNAEVCASITGGDIDCNEDYSDSYYRDCDVKIEYTVETDYEGGSYIEVEVECEVEIEYAGRNTYSTQSDSDNDDESYDLYAFESESDSMDFNFSLSAYKEITRVQISSAECEIESVELW